MKELLAQAMPTPVTPGRFIQPPRLQVDCHICQQSQLTGPLVPGMVAILMRQVMRLTWRATVLPSKNPKTLI